MNVEYTLTEEEIKRAIIIHVKELHPRYASNWQVQLDTNAVTGTIYATASAPIKLGDSNV